MAKYNAEQLQTLKDKGHTFPGTTSYPIDDREDLQNAIHAVGRGNVAGHDAIRKYIMRRAKEMGCADMIPDSWMGDGSMQNNSRAALLAGSRELRAFTEFEFRSGTGNRVTFEGYASLFDSPYQVTDALGTFTETVSRSAFDRTLNNGPDVVLNVDHGGLPLARTKNQSLRLGTDQRGLHVEAELNPEIGDVHDTIRRMQDGLLDEMSFAFRCVRDQWNDAQDERMLHEVAIDGGDVSIVTRGANRKTTANIRSALAALTDFDRVLVEARGAHDLDLTQLREAHENMGRLIRELTPRKTMSVKAAMLDLMTA